MFKKFIAKLTYLFNKRYSYYVVYKFQYGIEQGYGAQIIKNKYPELNLENPIVLHRILRQEVAEQQNWDYDDTYAIILNCWRFKDEQD